MKKYIPLEQYILEICNDNNISIGTGIIESETELKEIFIKFLEDNNWLSIIPCFVKDDSGKETLCITVDDARRIADNVLVYLQGLDMSIEEKNTFLLERMRTKFPQTTFLLQKYISENSLEIESVYCILDFILVFLQKDIFLYTNEDATKFIRDVCTQLTVKDGNHICDFLIWVQKKRKTAYSQSFVLNRRRESLTKSAYSKEKYIELLYYLFNPEYIRENNFYLKAVQSKKMIDIWLYLSLHFICALRDTDLAQIPHPRIKMPPDTILKAVEEGTFTKSEALNVINTVEWQLRNLPRNPSKTSRYSNVANIKITIPESIKEHFGVLFAIAEAHHQLSPQSTSALIRPIKDYESISRYLGDEIGELFLEEDFACRSANKSYMQAIEMLADDILESQDITHAKGYMLAALARSHKGSYGEFAKTTEIYLKDTKFSGYSPEFIAKELFERGVCSFVPSMLLRMITDNAYDKLSITKQTQLIKELKMTAGQIENTISLIEDTMVAAKNIVDEIVDINQDDAKRKATILRILHNIGCGKAISKNDDCLCLMTAMEKRCPYPDQGQCIGCSYEIHTKATIYVLSSEFKRLITLRNNAQTSLLQNKYTGLLKETVLPALNEIFICIKENYGEESLAELEAIITEVTQ